MPWHDGHRLHQQDPPEQSAVKKTRKSRDPHTVIPPYMTLRALPGPSGGVSDRSKVEEMIKELCNREWGSNGTSPTSLSEANGAPALHLTTSPSTSCRTQATALSRREKSTERGYASSGQISCWPRTIQLAATGRISIFEL